MADLVEQAAGIADSPPAQMNGQDEFALRCDRSPHPDPFGVFLNPCDQFIQLKMANLNSTKEQPLVQPEAVLATAFQPATNRRMMVSEDARGSGDIQSLAEGMHNHGYAMDGGFEMVHGGVQAAGFA